LFWLKSITADAGTLLTKLEISSNFIILKNLPNKTGLVSKLAANDQKSNGPKMSRQAMVGWGQSPRHQLSVGSKIVFKSVTYYLNDPYVEFKNRA
jgi:hypothetical protein